MVTVNLPLFFKPGVACKLLQCSLAELRTLYAGGVLNGVKEAGELRIASSSICMYLGRTEVEKKSYLWEKRQRIEKQKFN